MLIQAKLQEVHAARAELYLQADLVVQQRLLSASPTAQPASESQLVTAARVVAALAAMLEASDTKKRLRSVPEPGTVSLKGSRGPLQF